MSRDICRRKPRPWHGQLRAAPRIRAGKATGIQAGKTVGQAFDRYEKEVSAAKRGHWFEALRLAAIGDWKIEEAPFRSIRFRNVLLVDATSDLLGRWREHPLNVHKVTGSTVNRELNLLSNMFTVATKEWKWIAASPTTDVRRPKESKPRDRLYTDDEIKRICFALGLDLGDERPAETVSQRVAIAFFSPLRQPYVPARSAGFLRVIYPVGRPR